MYYPQITKLFFSTFYFLITSLVHTLTGGSNLSWTQDLLQEYVILPAHDADLKIYGY